jgi:hypothetical protein
MATDPTAPITLKATVADGKYVDVMRRATELADDDLGTRANALYVMARAGMETPRFKKAKKVKKTRLGNIPSRNGKPSR